MAEILEMRTRNSKTTDLGGGRFRIQASMGSIHKGTPGNYTPINNEIVAGVMSQADYSLTLLQNTFNAGQVVQFGVQGETVQFQPMALEWTNDLNQISQISTPKAVTGVTTNTPEPIASNPDNKTGKVKWTGAYGAGIDFEWECQTERLQKILSVNSLSNLTTPPAFIISGGNPVLRLNLIFAPSDGVDIYVDNLLWNKSSTVQTFTNIEFRKNSQVLWVFQPLRYWDSTENPRQSSIAILRKAGNNLYIEVRVPYSWLQSAVFPVIIDPSASVRVAASADDSGTCYWNGSVWSLSAYPEDQVRAGYEGSAYKQGGAMRWALAIPNAPTVTAATITLRARYNKTAHTANTRFTGVDVDTCAAWTDTLADYQALRGTIVGGATNANITSAQVDWDAIEAWTTPNDYVSPSLVTIVQEILNRAGWASGNYLGMFWDDHDGRSNAHRVGGAYDFSAATAPLIDITYTTVSPSKPYPSLGIKMLAGKLI